MAEPPALVAVSFVDTREQRVTRVSVSVRAGWSSAASRLTIDCHERAHDYGYTHWIQPHAPREGHPADWLVYKAESASVRHFLKQFTSRDAAEMWVLHHAK